MNKVPRSFSPLRPHSIRMPSTLGSHRPQAITVAGLLVTLGIIYGDIGTSPLYVFKAIIGERAITEQLVFGGISCVFWTLTIQTTFKYILLTLHADNRGEGGIFSLYALVRRFGGESQWTVSPGSSARKRDAML